MVAQDYVFDLPTVFPCGRHISLEPLTQTNRQEVGEAFATDDAVWAMLVNNGGPGGFDRWWHRASNAIESGRSILFAVRRQSDGKVVGTSGYLSFDGEHRRCEIGSTFFQPDARGGMVNPESKFILLDGAFSAGAHRVEFMTDALNARSRAALMKLGANLEGVLRRHKVLWTGRVRDTAVFSITDQDWTTLRPKLIDRIHRS